MAPDLPESLKMPETSPTTEKPEPLIDSHCHLFLPEFKADWPQVLERARQAGVTTIINLGLDARTNQEAFQLADDYPELRATVGWHPHEAEKCQKTDLLDLAQLAQRPDNLAIGEIGLDFYRSLAPKDRQIQLFHQLLDLAAQLTLPVVIHTREAFAETVAILKAHRPTLGRILIHCFTGSWDEAQAYLDLDCHFSIPGVVTFPQAAPLRHALGQIPHDKILLESDAPYLAPIPRRGRRNEPAYVAYTLLALAESLGTRPRQAAQLTTQNARRFFGL
ncbi:MAG: TatD family hydrolase [Deltaproteobacteria bacterium]|jgi:TatD DNase family protein|nr:TatD family hydrolase [Deltaproteobacteria bacterium]